MSTLKVNTIQDTSGGATTLVSAQNTAKAWVNFQGQGTVTIRQGYNVSSITDNAAGHYTVNFTTAMEDADYCACLACSDNTTGTTGYAYGVWLKGNTTYSSSSLTFTVGYPANADKYDQDFCNVVIFR